MSKRVLLIDDEANIRTMIRLALQFSGYEVAVAADGKEGLETFGQGEGWDLVLLDQRMPGLSGSEVHTEIRRRAPQARVVVITAYGTIDLAMEAIKHGAVDFLRKPFTADTLRASVKSAMERPVLQSSAIPAGLVLGAFTRTTINGFSFSPLGHKIDEKTSDRFATFDVAKPDLESSEVTVKLPPFVMELVKAYADCEEMPNEERFWVAMAEEALANFLWQNAELPDNNLLVVDNLSASLQRWLDEILTVDSESQNV